MITVCGPAFSDTGSAGRCNGSIVTGGRVLIATGVGVSGSLNAMLSCTGPGSAVRSPTAAVTSRAV